MISYRSPNGESNRIINQGGKAVHQIQVKQ